MRDAKDDEAVMPHARTEGNDLRDAKDDEAVMPHARTEGNDLRDAEEGEAVMSYRSEGYTWVVKAERTHHSRKD